MTAKLHITLPDQTEKEITLNELCQNSKYTVLYFYPKDNTSGCTIEAKLFADLKDEFATYDTQIIGVSKDNHKSHCKFQENHELPFALISDIDSTLQQEERFNVRVGKSMYGRKYMGTERSTFLLDQKGNIIQERRKVTPATHPQEVLEYVKGL